MKTIQLKPLLHNGEQTIAIQFYYDKEIIQHLKKVKGTYWNPKEKCWHAKFSEKNLAILKDHLGQVAEIDMSEFTSQGIKVSNFQKGERVPKILNPYHSGKLEKFESWLRQKRYSKRTIENYSNMIKTFMRYYNDLLIEEIEYDDIIRFNDEFIVKNKYSVTYQRQMISALKLFYQQIENRRINPDHLERPRKERKLPTVFSKEEIEAILKSIRNLKHKAIISLIYSGGLRISELINLRINDIDSNRMIIHIRQAKGKKDRIVGLSGRIVKLLREYYNAYKPKGYLFEGPGNAEFSATSCRAILKHAMKKAGIKKQGSLHTLRHSYATHLLENGTDIRYIQTLLGHKSSRTTEIYTHISKKHIEEIKSPFDELDLE